MSGTATVKKHRWLLDSYLLPDFAKTPVSLLAPGELLDVLKNIEREGKNETAHRVRSLAGRIFRYTHALGRAPQGDITASLRDALAPIVVTQHTSVTDSERIGELLLAIDGYDGLAEKRS